MQLFRLKRLAGSRRGPDREGKQSLGLEWCRSLLGMLVFGLAMYLVSNNADCFVVGSTSNHMVGNNLNDVCIDTTGTNQLIQCAFVY